MYAHAGHKQHSMCPKLPLSYFEKGQLYKSLNIVESTMQTNLISFSFMSATNIFSAKIYAANIF